MKKILFSIFLILCLTGSAQCAHAITRAIFPSQQDLQPPPEEVKDKMTENVNVFVPQSYNFNIYQENLDATVNVKLDIIGNNPLSASTSNLIEMKTLAQNGGIYLPPSEAEGYSFVFNADGTVSIYKVISLRDSTVGENTTSSSSTSTSTASSTQKTTNKIISSQQNDYQDKVFMYTITIPKNGIFFVEDNVWVEGTIKGKATITSAKFPYDSKTAPSIYIPNNIKYKTKDGSSSLGLISQKDILSTFYAPQNLEIDAGLLAQYGSVQLSDIMNAINATDDTSVGFRYFVLISVALLLLLFLVMKKILKK